MDIMFSRKENVVLESCMSMNMVVVFLLKSESQLFSKLLFGFIFSKPQHFQDLSRKSNCFHLYIGKIK